MADRRTLEIFKNDLTCLLTNYPGLDRTTVYSWIYKASDDIASRQKSSQYPPDINYVPFVPSPFWTIQAQAHYNKGKCNWAKSNRRLKGDFEKIFDDLHLEHSIPRIVVINWLIDGDPQNPTVNMRLDRAIELLSTTCWVTGKKFGPGSEQSILDQGMYRPTFLKIKDSMPPGWDVAKGDMWARYDAVRVLKNLAHNVLKLYP